MVALTVEKLIEALKRLPPDTVVGETSSHRRFHVFTDSLVFLVYERGDVIQLHIDDGAAHHADIERFRRSLFE